MGKDVDRFASPAGDLDRVVVGACPVVPAHAHGRPAVADLDLEQPATSVPTAQPGQGGELPAWRIYGIGGEVKDGHVLVGLSRTIVHRFGKK